MYLLEKPSLGIVAEIELFCKLMDNVARVVVLEHFDFFQVVAVQLYLKHADWLFNSWQRILKVYRVPLLRHDQLSWLRVQEIL